MAEFSYMEAALAELQSVLVERNRDYKIDGEFSNFEFAARVADLLPEDVMISQLAIKLGRIKGLKVKGSVNQDALLDSYKDLAGYATILFAYSLVGHIDGTDEDDPTADCVIDDWATEAASARHGGRRADDIDPTSDGKE